MISVPGLRFWLVILVPTSHVLIDFGAIFTCVVSDFGAIFTYVVSDFGADFTCMACDFDANFTCVVTNFGAKLVGKFANPISTLPEHLHSTLLRYAKTT